MMAALFADALLGYEFFLKTRGNATIEEVNEFLHSQSRYPIHPRTYTHYRKLISNGFRNYVPINKFDVFQSLGKVQMAAERRRYRREQVELPALISRNGTNWQDSTIIDRSLVGFGLVTLKRFPVVESSTLWIDIKGYSPIPTIVVWKKHLENSTRIGVRAIEFISNYRVSAEINDAKQLKGIVQVSRSSGDKIDWDYLVNLVGKTDELIQAVTDLIYSVADLVHVDVLIASPVLKSIKFESPGNVDVKVDIGVAETIQAVSEQLQTFGLKRKSYAEDIKSKEHANHISELDVVNKQIEVMRNAIHFAHESRSLGVPDTVIQQMLAPTFKKILGTDSLPTSLFQDGTPERAILENRVLPALTDLSAGDDPSLDVKAMLDNFGDRD